MRYGLNRLELEYRDCQVLREAAKGWLDGIKEMDFDKKGEFIQSLLKLSKQEMAPSKQERIQKICMFLEHMNQEYYMLLCKYLIHLSRTKIELGETFDINTGYYILPVNVHREECTFQIHPEFFSDE